MLALLLSLTLLATVNETPATEADWSIEVHRPSREVIYANGVATHFATDTGAREQRSYAGLYTSMHECLDDYVLALDGQPLEPETADHTEVRPWAMTRQHADGVRETLFVPDGEPALCLRLEADASAARSWSIAPRVDMRWIWKVTSPRYESAWDAATRTLLVRRPGWRPGEGALPFLALAVGTREARFEAENRRLDLVHPRDAARRAMERSHPVEVGRVMGPWPAGAHHLDLVFAQGATAEGARETALRLLASWDERLDAKRRRIETLAASPGLHTGDPRLDDAYRWARASMDVLVTRARGRGIYAGFHWFTNYWGRDTFICLPGATLVTGQLDTAEEILRGFLDFQLTDRSNPRLGRLPNIVQPGQLQYAGVDGTWWYVRAAYRYIQARRARGAADSAFERDFAPALASMIDGAERFAVDDQGLLHHGDGETWMDAGGEAHPFSPRGDRAVEVQALYYNGLRVAEWLAGEQGRAADAARYAELAERTRKSFARRFWLAGENRLADHLNADGSADRQIRPNGILAITAVEEAWPPLLRPEQVEAEVEMAFDRLVRPWGVTSLDPADPQFHPRHLDLAHYPYDEAYHNGDVWYWLTGPMITALCRVGRVEEARRLLDPLVAEILDHGAVGAIREIRDGADTGETEEFGGATFQAWSMAEMIRAMHEDLGPALGWVR